jgi:hypothetical protein
MVRPMPWLKTGSPSPDEPSMTTSSPKRTSAWATPPFSPSLNLEALHAEGPLEELHGGVRVVVLEDRIDALHGDAG